VTTQDEPIQDVESRYSSMNLTRMPAARSSKLWPTIAPNIDKAIDAILDAAARLPHLSVVIAQHRSRIKDLENVALGSSAERRP